MTSTPSKTDSLRPAVVGARFLTPVIVLLITTLIEPQVAASFFPETTPPSELLPDGLRLFLAILLVVLLAIWFILELSAHRKQAKDEAERDALIQGLRDQLNTVENHTVKLQAGLDQGRSLLLREKGVTYVGATNDVVIPRIQAELQGATKVRNSLIGVPESGVYHDDARELYHNFFSKNLTAQWLDLASYREIFGARFRFKLPHGVVGARHILRVLRHSVPLVNCLIVDRHGEAAIVFFGWTFDSNSLTAPVFVSTDKRLINMFAEHFEFLWNQKTTLRDILVDYSDGDQGSVKEPTIVDKLGVWLTVGFDNVGGAFDVESFGIVEIRYGTSGAKITGSIYRPDGSFKEPIDSQNIVVSMNRIVFDYGPSQHRRDLPGSCSYSFYFDAGTAFLKGFFANSQTRRWKEVLGLRIEDSPEFPLNEQQRSELLSAHKDRVLKWSLGALPTANQQMPRRKNASARRRPAATDPKPSG